MQSKINLLASSALRGLQMLFGIVVLGLSVTLAKDHYDHRNWDDRYGISKAPFILSLAAAIGGLSLVAAVFNLAIAWMEFLKGYIEMIVDVIIIVANVVGGSILAVRLEGRSCADKTKENQVGTGDWPYAGSLAHIDILNGGCGTYNTADIKGTYCYNADEDRWGHLNTRCTQSQTDAVFMFLTVIVLFATISLTYLRLKKSL